MISYHGEHMGTYGVWCGVGFPAIVSPYECLFGILKGILLMSPSSCRHEDGWTDGGRTGRPDGLDGQMTDGRTDWTDKRTDWTDWTDGLDG